MTFLPYNISRPKNLSIVLDLLSEVTPTMSTWASYRESGEDVMQGDFRGVFSRDFISSEHHDHSADWTGKNSPYSRLNKPNLISERCQMLDLTSHCFILPRLVPYSS